MKIDRKRILHEQFSICLRCAKPLKDFHVHHIDRSGNDPNPNDKRENLCALHKHCHDVVHMRFSMTGHMAYVGTPFELAMFQVSLQSRNNRILKEKPQTPKEIIKIIEDFNKMKEMLTDA
jgi:5-methylcytosine-specific restriction endonuclease McrA